MRALQRVLHYNRYILGVVLCLAGGWGIHALLMPSEYHIFCDTFFAHEVRERIHTFSPCKNALVLFEELKKEIPSVSSISISYRSSRQALVSIKSEQPRVLIEPLVHERGPSYVVTASGNLREKRYFNSERMEHLPVVRREATALEHLKNREICISLLAIRPEIFEDYAIIWCSKNEITLYSTKYPDLTVIADNISIHQKEKFAYVEAIYERRHEQYPKGIKIDIRLKGSLVCGPPGGEANHEKSIAV